MVKKNKIELEDMFKSKSGMDFLDTSSENVSDDEVLDYLARIMADLWLSSHTLKGRGLL